MTNKIRKEKAISKVKTIIMMKAIRKLNRA